MTRRRVRAKRAGAHNLNTAKPCQVDGYRFKSMLEANRYGQLKALQRAGHVAELVVHPTYPLHVNASILRQRVDVDGQQYDGAPYIDQDRPGTPLFVHTTKGAPTQRIRVAEMDFAFFDVDKGQYVIEDVKGNVDTPLARHKRDHVAAQYGIVPTLYPPRS